MKVIFYVSIEILGYKDDEHYGGELLMRKGRKREKKEWRRRKEEEGREKENENKGEIGRGKSGRDGNNKAEG